MQSNFHINVVGKLIIGHLQTQPPHLLNLLEQPPLGWQLSHAAPVGHNKWNKGLSLGVPVVGQQIDEALMSPHNQFAVGEKLHGMSLEVLPDGVQRLSLGCPPEPHVGHNCRKLFRIFAHQRTDYKA
jgi:hypothetical protein